MGFDGFTALATDARPWSSEAGREPESARTVLVSGDWARH